MHCYSVTCLETTAVSYTIFDSAQFKYSAKICGSIKSFWTFIFSSTTNRPKKNKQSLVSIMVLFIFLLFWPSVQECWRFDDLPFVRVHVCVFWEGSTQTKPEVGGVYNWISVHHSSSYYSLCMWFKKKTSWSTFPTCTITNNQISESKLNINTCTRSIDLFEMVRFDPRYRVLYRPKYWIGIGLFLWEPVRYHTLPKRHNLFSTLLCAAC